MKREVFGMVAAALLAVGLTACSQSERSPAGPSSFSTGINVLASIADEVIGDARNSCPSDLPTGLAANANNGKVDIASRSVANVSRYVFRIERRVIDAAGADVWTTVQTYTADGKPLFTVKLASGIYRVSERTPCMPDGVFTKAVEFSV